jgi:ornithine cyclodeaminase
MKIRVFSGKEVAEAISMPEAIEAVKSSFIQLSTEKARVPLRAHISGRREGSSLIMPAYLMESDSLAVKIVSVFPQNAEKNLPTVHAVVVVLDANTGKPLALIEGTYLTALRTGAASGLATELLARKDCRVAAIFGAGVQSRSQLEGLCSVRRLEKVWVYDIDRKRAEAFKKEMKAKGEPILEGIFVADSPSQAVQEADIISTATTSHMPVFRDDDLKSGVHINGIGSYTPDMQEIPQETVKRAKVVVDSREAVLAEAGDLIIPLKKRAISEDHIHGEIGEVASGRIPARESKEELSFFKSVGNAVQDAAVASCVLRRGEELGLGKEMNI